jgi:glycosyltransferase involved in cell wall biosynthesis
MKAKRVAFYCCDFYPNQSGYSYAFQAMVKGLLLADRECEVDVFSGVSLGGGAEWAPDRVNVVRLSRSAPNWAGRTGRAIFGQLIRPYLIARKITAFDKTKGYSYVVFESIDDPLVMLFVSRGILKKSIVRIHATSETEYALWAGGLYQTVRRMLIQRLLVGPVVYVASTSKYYLDFVKRWYLADNAILIAKKRFCVVPNSIEMSGDVSHGPFSERGARRHFVTLGRMDRNGVNQKGFEDIIGALWLVCEADRSSMRITFVGAGSERARLLRAARAVPFVECEFIERLPNNEVSKLIRSADCVVLASRYEGMSVFAMEALASGAPVVFSDAGGLRGLVQGNGFAFPSGDQQSLAKALSEVARSSSDQLEAMSRRSVELAAKYSVIGSGRILNAFAAQVESGL